MLLRTVRGARVIGLVAVMMVMVGTAVWGHRLIAIDEKFPSREQAHVVEDESISQVAYVELTDEASEAWLRIDVSEPTSVFLSLGVPAIDRLSAYRPSVRVVGPGGETEQTLFVSNGEGVPRAFHEPFTNTDSWILVESWVSLPSAGTYHIVAASEPSAADKLWISVGRREVFGIADVFSLPEVIRDVREFHEVQTSLGVAARDWAALLAFVVVAGVVVYFAAK